MVRILLILLIGGAIGYSYGFRDAKQHRDTVVTRVLDRVGGDAQKYSRHNPTAAVKTAEQ